MNKRAPQLRDYAAYFMGVLCLLMVSPVYAQGGDEIGLDGLTRALETFGPVLAVLCIFIGFILVGYSLLKAATLNRPDGGGAKPAIVVSTLLTGVFLINIGLVVDTMSRSMGFSTEASLVLSEGKFYTAESEFAEYASGINFAFAVIQIVGALAIARGLILIKKSSQGGASGQGSSIGHAATHLVGGTLALNIKPFLGILGTTMGGDANSIIQMIIDGVTRV
jgi:hypothetical protein